MFKIYKNIFIHYSILLLVGCLALNGSSDAIGLIIVSVFLHEFGHLTMLYLTGQQHRGFIIHGFGISLRLSSVGVPYKDMLLISCGGPVISFLAAGIFYFTTPQLFLPNLCIGIINLLPVFPLDGGQIAYILLSRILGRKRSKQILKAAGILTGAFLIVCGVYLMYLTYYNITLLLMGIFIFFSAFTSTTKSFVDSGINPVSHIKKSTSYIIPEHYKAKQVASFLPPDSLGAVASENGEILGYVTTAGIYHKMSMKGYDISIKDCLI